MNSWEEALRFVFMFAGGCFSFVGSVAFFVWLMTTLEDKFRK